MSVPLIHSLLMLCMFPPLTRLMPWSYKTYRGLHSAQAGFAAKASGLPLTAERLPKAWKISWADTTAGS